MRSVEVACGTIEWSARRMSAAFGGAGSVSCLIQSNVWRRMTEQRVSMRDAEAGLKSPVAVDRTWDMAAVGLGLLAIVLVVANVSGPIRGVVVFAAASSVPGWAVVSHLAVRELAARLCFTIVASLVIGTLLSLAMVWTGFWHPVPVTVALLVISVVSIAVLRLKLLRARRGRHRK